MQPDAISVLGRSLVGGSAVVSATNGKTTTAKMAAAILEPEHRLCRNTAGANLESGIASALIGRNPAATGLFEVDEAALPAIVGALAPRVLVLGNLFRDQLDRYGELETVGARWRTMVAGLPRETTVVYNADDPLVASIASSHPATVAFGIDDSAAALPALPHAADSKWCPGCGTRLVYDAVYLGHLGSWHCPTGDVVRPALDVVARSVTPDGLDAVAFQLTLGDDSVPVRLPLPGTYNVYNALAAAALARSLAEVAAERVRGGLESFSAAFGRFERVQIGGRDAILLLIKNPAGANEVVRTLCSDPEPMSLLVALNDRIADGRDVSWIWDVDFEPLEGRVGHAVVTGTRGAEMGVRLAYAGVPRSEIEVAPTDAAVDRAAAAGSGPLYVLATYTAMLELRKQLAGRGIVRPYWEAA
jgi:lipid II isoglutaminyl synthase (glutamine-hydrolysing)